MFPMFWLYFFLILSICLPVYEIARILRNKKALTLEKFVVVFFSLILFIVGLLVLAAQVLFSQIHFVDCALILPPHSG